MTHEAHKQWPITNESLALAKQLEPGVQFVTLMSLEGQFYYTFGSDSLFGYSRAEMVGHNLLEFLMPVDHDAAQLLLSDSRLTSRTVKVGLSVITKDGRLVPIRASARLLANQGHPVLLATAKNSPEST